MIIAVLLYSCRDNSPNIVPFDFEKQEKKDNELLVSFLKKHYFEPSTTSTSSSFGTIKVLKTATTGKKSLFEQIKQLKVKENEVEYTLYYYIYKQGIPSPAKNFPTIMDSILVKYNGQRIIKADSISKSFDSRNSVTWLDLNSVIKGWTYGFTKFKGGKNITSSGPITYENSGRGILFIPSGLAYKNRGNGAILPNENLLFYIDLLDHVENTDHDNDGVPSIKEDPNNNGNPRDDDTDKDRIPNYLDVDDDGDSKLTKNEDTNGDGDPTNDDTDKDGIPNYLDSDS